MTYQHSYFGDDAATFGDRVAAARETLGLTQAQLAGRLGVRATTVENWESDRSEPRANRLQMLAGILNVSIVWLLTGAGEGGVRPVTDDEREEDAGDALLAEIRGIRMAQAQIAERLARVERRLRAGAGPESASEAAE